MGAKTGFCQGFLLPPLLRPSWVCLPLRPLGRDGPFGRFPGEMPAYPRNPPANQVNPARSMRSHRGDDTSDESFGTAPGSLTRRGSRTARRGG